MNESSITRSGGNPDDIVGHKTFSTTVDKRVAKQWRDSGYNVEPCYRGTPPATSAGLGADEIARITCEKWNIEKD